MRLQIKNNSWLYCDDSMFLCSSQKSDHEYIERKITHKLNKRKMTIYRNHHVDELGESHGYSFHLKKSDALRAFTEGSWHEYYGDEKAEKLNIKISKDGLIRCLVRHASHPNNG